MNRLCEDYQEINLSNYDENDVRALRCWAWEAYDEIEKLHNELSEANKILVKIKELL